MNTENVLKWVERTLYSVDDDKGPCCKLTLRHVQAGGNSSKDGDVWSVKIEHNDECVTLPEEDCLELVHDIEEAASCDADGLGGVQRYKLLAYFVRESVPRRFTFRMKGAGDEVEDDDALSEPATKQGHMAQMMRHNEAIMRISVSSQAKVSAIMQKTVASQQDQIDKLLKDRRAGFEMMEDLRSKHHERELATLEFEHSADMKEKALEKGSMLIPAIVNRLSGRKILPESATPAEQMMLSLAESLSAEQIEKLLMTMSADQQVTFCELLEATRKEEKTEVSNNRRLPGKH